MVQGHRRELPLHSRGHCAVLARLARVSGSRCRARRHAPSAGSACTSTAGAGGGNGRPLTARTALTALTAGDAVTQPNRCTFLEERAVIQVPLSTGRIQARRGVPLRGPGFGEARRGQARYKASDWWQLQLQLAQQVCSRGLAGGLQVDLHQWSPTFRRLRPRTLYVEVRAKLTQDLWCTGRSLRHGPTRCAGRSARPQRERQCRGRHCSGKL